MVITGTVSVKLHKVNARFDCPNPHGIVSMILVSMRRSAGGRHVYDCLVSTSYATERSVIVHVYEMEEYAY